MSHGTNQVEIGDRAAFPAPDAARPKPKVVHVGKFYPPHFGGIESHLRALCVELRKSIDVNVVVASDDRRASEETMEGVSVTRVPTWLTLASTPFCPGMIGKIRASATDVVHVHVPNPTATLAYLASGHRGRLVVTYHSDTVRQRLLGLMFEPFLHALLRKSSAIIVSSPNYLQSSSILSAYKERCHLIPFGIALDTFESSDPSAIAAVRQQYGDRLIVSVGRLVYYKGFEYLIRAMTQIQGTLLIVGEGPLRNNLAELISDLGLAGRVHLLGRVSHEELVSCYHAADAFVLPSIVRSEAFGIVQIEAMAAGLPVVNTQLDSGVPFVSVHGKTGLTVPPADSGALASAINRLLGDENLRRSLGNAARERARQEFSLDRMTSRTLALYDTVMGSR